MKTKVVLLIVVCLFLLNFISATCTVTFDKASYYPADTVTATMSCTDVNEKLQSYTLNWTFNGVTQYELDNGTTPNAVSTPFYQTFILNSTYAGTINATLTGTNLEGTDGANVSGTSSKVLTITDLKFTPYARIGSLFSTDFKVTTNTGKFVSNARCTVFGTDNNGAPLQPTEEIITHHGYGIVGAKLQTVFKEGLEYLCRIRCDCGIGDNACFDEEGTQINSSSGSTTIPFTTTYWLYVNTLTDASNYIEKEEIFICANLTNVNYDQRILTDIYHQVRCSAGTDNNSDLDRALVISDDANGDRRGINPSTTQMQCKRFVVPEPRYLQGKSSQCYASTDVWVLDDNSNKIFLYRTTSPLFNITLSDLQIQPDWTLESDYRFNSIINLSDSSYNDYSGIGTAGIDLRLDKVAMYVTSYEQEILPEIDFNTLLMTKYIKSFTTSYCNGTLVDSAIEINDDGNLEIELRNVGIAPTGDNCYNVTLNLNSFDERQASSLEGLNSSQASSLGYLSGLNVSNYLQYLQLNGINTSNFRSANALEGIENKTGTFKMSIECPESSAIESSIACQIAAQVEDSQTVEKEVAFTCYIKDSNGTYSSTSWNKMITKNISTIEKSFYVLDNFTVGSSKQVFCEASYYNLGSRTDTFYDSFIITAKPIAEEGTLASSIGWLKEKAKDIVDNIIPTITDATTNTTNFIIENKLLFIYAFFAIIFLIIFFYILKKVYAIA